MVPPMAVVAGIAAASSSAGEPGSVGAARGANAAVPTTAGVLTAMAVGASVESLSPPQARSPALLLELPSGSR